MDINHILVKGCALCDVFLNPNKYLKTKIYYKNNRIEDSDFIIIHCNKCNMPIIIIRDHVVDISKELWGRILYVVRKEFGINTKLKLQHKESIEHWHAYIED